MPNVPKEYEAVIALAQAELAKVSQQKKPGQVLKQVYEELVQQFIASGANPEDFNPHLTLYTASQIARVIGKVQSIAKAYPPTKRKGVGKDGGVIKLNPGEWIFLFEGHQGTPAGEFDPEESPDIPTGGLDWAPAGEIGRAQEMLRAVADEMNFGYGDDALAFIREVAKRLGGRWGLNGKRGNPNDPSTDLLAWNIPGYLPQCWDVIQDAGGENRITWQPLRWGGPSVWLAP